MMLNTNGVQHSDEPNAGPYCIHEEPNLFWRLINFLSGYIVIKIKKEDHYALLNHP